MLGIFENFNYNKYEDPYVSLSYICFSVPKFSFESLVKGPLYQYTPLTRPVVKEKTTKSSNISDGEYSSDNEPPGIGGESDSDSDEDFSKPKAKQSRQGLWARRDALVPDDGGGDTFKKMAAAYQMQRDAQGLNKKRRNNIWGSFIQEETLNAEMTGMTYRVQK